MTRICLLLLAVLCLGADIAFGADEPPTLEALLKLEAAEETGLDAEEAGFGEEMRRSAMRAAALAFGAQAGLARRGFEIARMLERHGARLSAIYRFRDLMLREREFTVMPPVLAATDRAFMLERNGTHAASARRVLRIVEPERIVSGVPHWRDFLMREWDQAQLPAALLFPRDGAEAVRWRGWLRRGWAQGTALADDIFAADLERLNRVFEGLVLWRRANLGGMVSAPSLETAHIAVSGHGRLVRIDETVAGLGAPAGFELRPDRWRALPEGDDPSVGTGPSAGNTPAGGLTPAGGRTPWDGGTRSGAGAPSEGGAPSGGYAP